LLRGQRQVLLGVRNGHFMDFADALHLAKAQGCSVFMSFDRKLIKFARGRSPIPVLAP